MEGKTESEQAFLRSILANICREICHPLESLQGGIDRLLDEPAGTISDAERVQAATMREICKDLGQLTRESLGTAG